MVVRDGNIIGYLYECIDLNLKDVIQGVPIAVLDAAFTQLQPHSVTVEFHKA
jgi:hypothetical protein